MGGKTYFCSITCAKVRRVKNGKNPWRSLTDYYGAYNPRKSTWNAKNYCEISLNCCVTCAKDSTAFPLISIRWPGFSRNCRIATSAVCEVTRQVPRKVPEPPPPRRSRSIFPIVSSCQVLHRYSRMIYRIR